jgi:iron complex outermembrane receptor protein
MYLNERNGLLILREVLVRRISTHTHVFSMALFAATAFWFSCAEAQIVFHFDLPAQSLARSLTAIGTTTNTGIGFSASQVAGHIAPALKADLTVDDALARVLIGTKLRLKHLNDRTIAIAAMESSTSGYTVDGPSPTKASATVSMPGDSVDAMSVADSSASLIVAQTTTSGPNNTASLDSNDEQTKATHLDEIVVTGTYIRHTDPLSPIITLTQSELLDQGYSRLDQALEDLPQNFKGGGASSDSNGIMFTGAGSSANQTYSSGVNLRGLGTEATLVLLNGRRLPATSSGQSVDISVIPLSIIDRVEIVPDGASATYGSDAIAGVVNIITKTEYSGVDSGLRVDSIAPGKAPNDGAYSTFGTGWGDGNIIASVDFDKSNPLFARDRSFTSTAADPTSLLPDSETFAGYVSLHQKLTDQLTLSGDLLASWRTYDAALDLPGFAVSLASGRADRGVASAQLDYALPKDWVASFVGGYSREKDPGRDNYVGAAFETWVDTYGSSSFESRAEGPVMETPGGSVRAAVGASIRWETLRQAVNSDPLIEGSRTISAGYAEVLIPLVGAPNAVPLVRKLTLDVAGRYDHYSDFGHTSNPKLSLRWEMMEGLSAHASYTRSFRAPSLAELDLAANNYAYIDNVPNPASPTGATTTLLLDSNNPSLTAETARSYVGGLTFAPGGPHALKLDLSYFNIDYTDRIVELYSEGFYYNVIADARLLGSLVNLTPTQAQIVQQLSVPGRIIENFTSGPGTPHSIQAIANIGYVNVGSSRVQGLDADGHYAIQTGVGDFATDVTASYFLRFADQVTSLSQPYSILNTPYNPVRLKGHLGLQWSNGGWLAFGRVNESGSYRNPVDTSCSPGGCPIRAWTTVDLSLSYTTGKVAAAGPWDGIRLTFSAFNVFDRDPPYINDSQGQVGMRAGINYDPVNASALGRTFGLSFTKRWAP